MTAPDAHSEEVTQRKHDCEAITARIGGIITHELARTFSVPVRYSAASVRRILEVSSKEDANTTMFAMSVPHEYIDLERKRMRGLLLTEPQTTAFNLMDEELLSDVIVETRRLVEKIKEKGHDTPLRRISVELTLHMFALISSPPRLFRPVVCEY